VHKLVSVGLYPPSSLAIDFVPLQQRNKLEIYWETY